jgi:hypothetical protein
VAKGLIKRKPLWKLAPPSASPLPSLGRKLSCEAHASISVPSTEKCSSDNSQKNRLKSQSRSTYLVPRLHRMLVIAESTDALLDLHDPFEVLPAYLK